MSEYERLKERLKQTPVLMADNDTGTVALITEAEAVRLKFEDGKGIYTAHALGGLPRFARMAGKQDRRFTFAEISNVAGTSRVREWLPSADTYGWTDAFVAGLCGTMHRNAVKEHLIVQVPALFREGTNQPDPDEA